MKDLIILADVPFIFICYSFDSITGNNEIKTKIMKSMYSWDRVLTHVGIQDKVWNSFLFWCKKLKKRKEKIDQHNYHVWMLKELAGRSCIIPKIFSFLGFLCPDLNDSGWCGRSIEGSQGRGYLFKQTPQLNSQNRRGVTFLMQILLNSKQFHFYFIVFVYITYLSYQFYFIVFIYITFFLSVHYIYFHIRFLLV